MSERKTHVLLGILIGMGIMMIMLGGLGWMAANYVFDTLSRTFQILGADSRHYIFSDLIRMERANVFLMAVGVFSLLAGTIGLVRQRRAKPA